MSDTSGRSLSRSSDPEDEQVQSLFPESYVTDGSLALAPVVEPVKWTERMLLDRLRVRHGRDSGNGPEWVYMEHVADQTGWANRRIDRDGSQHRATMRETDAFWVPLPVTGDEEGVWNGGH